MDTTTPAPAAPLALLVFLKAIVRALATLTTTGDRTGGFVPGAGFITADELKAAAHAGRAAYLAGDRPAAIAAIADALVAGASTSPNRDTYRAEAATFLAWIESLASAS